MTRARAKRGEGGKEGARFAAQHLSGWFRIVGYVACAVPFYALPTKVKII